MDNTILDYDVPRDRLKIIKVIGVGGGGGNAVTHMYRQGIHDVSFVLCNTDNQALERSDVPERVVLGEKITQGLGAGNKPERARQAAEESLEVIKNMLGDGTKMVFITAGMGGGTGTGAAPVIARIAKEMDILTVGIVTIPFMFEGETKIIQALNGVEEIGKNVDALLVINNERLFDIYGDFSMREAFAKADDTLATAAKSIAEIITVPGIINLDFADVHTTMKDGGVALMSNGFGEGEGRVKIAIEEALTSPLLNNNDIFTARKILFNVSFSEDAELKMKEMNDVDEFMARFNSEIDVIWGTAIDNSLGGKVKMTILATGFGMEDIPQIAKKHQDEIEKNQSMIGRYYEDLHKHRISNVSSRHKIVVLSADELDDDAIIGWLEGNPTYKRSSKSINDFRSKISGNLDVSTTTSTSQNTKGKDSSGGKVISFN
ncbi:cell division protein FtsZ [Parabacteroides sp. PF5-5]|uniref:cell division protein FtsZ n=1 Tax=unclassified Parabacteroides TaxID=2649774 RepID=UPI002474867D|nr:MULTISPECIES: cell division protein FtsZ [unclassified Parabacteroides]MDH6303369.1 cell division protein FtsZ [Parabacteroides sp. PH5-39]MDH6314692.1 cell division protein FtsZ [Parabacteroides sp. PF5-13]MDH6318029.1 cell division protein FtsZ [Parabacteroides sp. PH5-13]MDH6322040.1 cell division protein FtsZ [Parabacteroides sp. PH5-8]MDH6326163.1 cell division protein FtsZ [Parabacteroides sp. PH5-41]